MRRIKKKRCGTKISHQKGRRRQVARVQLKLRNPAETDKVSLWTSCASIGSHKSIQVKKTTQKKNTSKQKRKVLQQQKYDNKNYRGASFVNCKACTCHLKMICASIVVVVDMLFLLLLFFRCCQWRWYGTLENCQWNDWNRAHAKPLKFYCNTKKGKTHTHTHIHIGCGRRCRQKKLILIVLCLS